jgi:nicotinamide-nucleotide amidase
MSESRQQNNESASPEGRSLRTAALLAIGSELTVGETRDTNSGDLARSLSRHGVEIAWIAALPDRMAAVVDALRDALRTVDLVVTTGGLGPTPDDLTREAIAAVVGERPAVDPDLERWLRHLFERRTVAFPETNLKQAWLIPSATAIPNERGTAPGWWVDRPDGRVIVALPGPPGEMRPMWEGWVLPHLTVRGLGEERVTQTFRLAGIGESAVAALLGEPLLRAENPVVATYARSDAVDVRISARTDGGRSAAELVEGAAAVVLAAVGDLVWGRDDDNAPIAGLADQARRTSGVTVGLAVRAVESGEDTAVEVAACGPWGTRETSQTTFLGGSEGRRRAGIAAASFLNGILRDESTTRRRSTR